MKALPVEDTVAELQRQKAEKSNKINSSNDVESSIAPSVSAVEEEENKSIKTLAINKDTQPSQPGGEGPAGPKHEEFRAKKSKIQLWNEMKIKCTFAWVVSWNPPLLIAVAIARAFTLIYTICLLTLITRIQLNLLGRRNYLASVVSLATPLKGEAQISLENHDDDNAEQAYGNDFEINRKYLSFSWWLLHRGCINLMEKVIAAVEEVFGSVNPREDITLARLSELTLMVRQKVEGDTEEIRR